MDNRKHSTIAEAAWIMFLVTPLLSLLCCSPKVVEVPAERYVTHTDTIYRALTRADTVVDRDSVFTFIRGDTVRIETVKWRWRIRESRDTVRQVLTDSVYREVPVEVVREVAVEKPRPGWLTALAAIGGLATALAVAAAAAAVRRKLKG